MMTAAAALLNLLIEGEDEYPSITAFMSACSLVANVRTPCLEDFRASASASVDSSGGIRLTWNDGDSEVRLVIPGDLAGQMYIYQEDGKGVVSELTREVTAAILGEKLKWLEAA